MDITAAVVKAVGQKANWSESVSDSGGVNRMGYITHLVMILSITRDSTGVIEIGL